MKSLIFSSKNLIVAPIFTFLLVSLAAGCGGGGASPDPDVSGPAIVNNSLSLNDFRDTKNNSYYDIYVCDVRQNGVASVEMRSLDVDAYIFVYRKNSKGDFDLIDQNDDISAQSTDARLEFSVLRGKSYRIIATSAEADERGNYGLLFSENLGRPARVLPNVNRTAQSNAQNTELPLIGPKKARN